MNLDEKKIQPNPTPIYAFEGTKAQPIGDVTLPVIAAGKTLFVTFVIHPPEQEKEDNSELSTIEPLKEEVLDPSYPGRKVLVGSFLLEDEVEQLMKLLRENKDVFVWSHTDMPGIDLENMCHRLNVDLNHPRTSRSRGGSHLSETKLLAMKWTDCSRQDSFKKYGPGKDGLHRRLFAYLAAHSLKPRYLRVVNSNHLQEIKSRHYTSNYDKA
ncbi:unnamed protein product [Prunus brigantina]